MTVMEPRATEPNAASNQVSTAGELAEHLADIVRMVAYIRDQGIALPDDIEGDVAQILAAPPQVKSGLAAIKSEEIKRVLHVHGRLSQLVAPATPRSLAATDFRPENERARYTLLLIWFLGLFAGLGLIGYVLTLPPPVMAPVQPTPASMAPGLSGGLSAAGLALDLPPLVESIRLQLNFLAAAALGSAFAGLLIASDYLKNRTFDPRYLPVYYIRFFVGLLAGSILANLGSQLFEGNSTIATLGPGIIALLGGYSAEAVKQILDRLVEVLVTVVKGKDTSGEERMAATKAVMAAVSDPATTQEVRDAMAALLKKMQR